MSSFNTLSANSQDIQKFQMHQKARSILIVAVVGVPVFLAMLAYLFYRNAISTKQTNSTTSTTIEQQLSAEDTPSSSIPNETVTTGQDPNQQYFSANPGSSSSTNQSGQSSAPTQQQSPNIQSTNTGIPQGVETAINSIESNGIKGNPYVSSNLDTSQVPIGTSVKFDRSTWSQYSESSGSVKVSLSVMGLSKTGSVTFGIEGGSWKATGYSID